MHDLQDFVYQDLVQNKNWNLRRGNTISWEIPWIIRSAHSQSNLILIWFILLSYCIITIYVSLFVKFKNCLNWISLFEMTSTCRQRRSREADIQSDIEIIDVLLVKPSLNGCDIDSVSERSNGHVGGRTPESTQKTKSVTAVKIMLLYRVLIQTGLHSKTPKLRQMRRIAELCKRWIGCWGWFIQT